MTGEDGRLSRLRPRTVRSQVTLTATGLVALVLVLSAFGLVAAQQRVLLQGIDEALIQRADNIEHDVVRGVFGTRLAEITYIPKTTVELDKDNGKKVLQLLDDFEDQEDVQNAYANFDLPEELMNELGG